jgi:hypothetical protein
MEKYATISVNTNGNRELGLKLVGVKIPLGTWLASSQQKQS